jgi:hypothetical protein
MNSEHDLLAAGPAAVLDAVRKYGSSLNLSVLAQACGREARSHEQFNAALEWTEAAIAAYSAEAAAADGEFTRNGLEVVAFGLRAAMILRFGLVADRIAQYLADIERWLLAGARVLDSPAQLNVEAQPRGPRTPHALLVRERFLVAAELWKQGLLRGKLDEWFAAVISPPNA